MSMFALFVQSLGRDVRSSRPSYRATLDSGLSKDFQIPKRRENGTTIQVLRKVDDRPDSIIEFNKLRVA